MVPPAGGLVDPLAGVLAAKLCPVLGVEVLRVLALSLPLFARLGRAGVELRRLDGVKVVDDGVGLVGGHVVAARVRLAEEEVGYARYGDGCEADDSARN